MGNKEKILFKYWDKWYKEKWDAPLTIAHIKSNDFCDKVILPSIKEYANQRVIEVLEEIKNPNMGETYGRLRDKISELKSLSKEQPNNPNDIPDSVG